MLFPKKTKYRKMHKGRNRGLAKGGYEIAYGNYALKSLGFARITSKQIEACRVSINRYLKRSGKLFTRIFPDIPVTSKPAEVRMGKGKGNVEYWAARVQPGRILFELDGVSQEMAYGAFEKAAAKLPISVRYVKRFVDEE